MLPLLFIYKAIVAFVFHKRRFSQNKVTVRWKKNLISAPSPIICQHFGSALLKTHLLWHLSNYFLTTSWVVTYWKQKTIENAKFLVSRVVAVAKKFEKWSLTREFLKQYLTGKQNGCLQSGRLREVVAYKKWSQGESWLYSSNSIDTKKNRATLSKSNVWTEGQTVLKNSYIFKWKLIHVDGAWDKLTKCGVQLDAHLAILAEETKNDVLRLS